MRTFIIIALIVLIIWLVTSKVNAENADKMRQVSGELRVKYPNFVRAIREIYANDATLYADNNKALSYKIPISTFKRHMGDFYYSLIDTSNIGNKPYVIQVYKGLDRIEIATEKYYLPSDEDLTIEEYGEIFVECAKEIMADPRYLNSISILNK